MSQIFIMLLLYGDRMYAGNIAIIIFSTKDSAEKAITGINKTNKYTNKNINMKPIAKYF